MAVPEGSASPPPGTDGGGAGPFERRPGGAGGARLRRAGLAGGADGRYGRGPLWLPGGGWPASTRPSTPWSPAAPGGPAPTRAQVAEWWSHWPGAGVGVLTGAASGLVVVDVDPAHGGKDSLARLRESGTGLPRTLYARTGGGGWHLFYRRPGVRWATPPGGWGPRAARGGLCGPTGVTWWPPPRGTASGGRYAWHAGPEGLAPLPAWVTRRRRDWGPYRRHPGSRGANGSVPMPPPPWTASAGGWRAPPKGCARTS